MPVTTLSKNPDRNDAEVTEDMLPGGFVATTTHAGPYEGLTSAHAAVQQWTEAQGFVTGAAPWEVYVTDPADYSDPKDWKTDVFWPLAGEGDRARAPMLAALSPTAW